MSIKRLNWKLIAHLALFWLLVLSLGCLLASRANGSGAFGNGSGGGIADAGDGTGRADHGSGSGMSASDGDGPGASEEAAETAPSPATEEEATPPDAQDAATAQEADASDGPAGSAAPAPPEDAAAKRAAVQTFEEASLRAQRPKLWNNNADDDGDTSPDSKVISLKEAKKGFFGVEVSGKSNAVFLLDLSGSMGTPTSEGMSRLELLKNIFCNEIDRLHRECQEAELQTQVGSFCIATFSDQLDIYPKRGAFSYGSPQDVANAKQIVRNLHTQGGTEMMNAWTNLEPMLRRVRCNIVLFLSDGDPTDCSHQQLLDFLRQKLPRQRISTFSLGCQSDLMEQVAKGHNGKYRAIL